MRRFAAVALVAAAIGGAGFWVLTRPATLPAETLAALQAHEADAEAGAQVFWAAGCAGCHAAPGLTGMDPVEDRLVLSGGRRLESDFGTFVAPNISPHPEAGIGGWSLEDFARATLLGVSPDGRHYYPSFPYTGYIRMTPGDLADLWAFWQGLPADDTPSASHELGFPYTLRRGLGLWKALHLAPGFVTDVAAEAERPELERGRYLSEALAHCGECHTPRGLTGGLDAARWMAGAPNPSGRGRIPALPPEGWTEQQIALYLGSGFTPEFDLVGGSMADVVEHMKQLPDTDHQAIAAYLMALEGR